jgi:hypothetical protein
VSSDAPEQELPPPETPAETGEKPRFDRRRWARLFVLAGALAAVLAAKSFVLPLVPVDRDVEMEIASPGDVTRLDVRWSAPGSDEDITATSLSFPAGQAPSTVRLNVRLPDGTYEAAIAVERASRVDSTRRRITFSDAARVTIPLR